MNILTRHLSNLGHSFFSVGWMAVALLPLTQVLGRAAFNITGSIYLAWGLASMFMLRRHARLPPAAWVLYAMLIAAFSASLLVADDLPVATSRLKTFVLYSLVAFPLAAALRTAADVERLVAAFAVGGSLTVAAVYATYFVQHGDPGFKPETGMREDNLPFLLPLILCALYRHLGRPAFLAASGIATAAVVAYVILSNGRSALLGLIAGLSVFATLALRLRTRTVVLIAIAIVLAAIAVRGEHFYRRHVKAGQDIMTTLNRSSSFRLELWSNAIRTPPDNLLLGAGLGNTPRSLLVVNTATSANLRHLHNFVLDTWHETGLLGLTMLMAWLAYLIHVTFDAWRRATVTLRMALGSILGASAAILTSALLSFSYGSKQFACYLFVLLVAGVASREIVRRGAVDPDVTQPGTR